MNIKEETKARFDADATEYEARIKRHVNGYDDLHASLINMIPFENDAHFTFWDLGIGSGKLSLEILKRFPNSNLIGMDFSRMMLNICEKRFEAFKDRVKLVEGDFEKKLPNLDPDLVIMVLALHHLEDESKQNFISLLFTRLKNNGALFIGDLTKSRHEWITTKYMNLWRENLRRNGYSDEYIEKCYKEKYLREDKPAPPEDHLLWMERSGFKEIEVFWKKYHFTAFGGFKKQSSKT